MGESPFYRFFRRIDLPMSFDEWERLPRFTDYKKEYWKGEAHFDPRPKTCDVFLNLARPLLRCAGDRRETAEFRDRAPSWRSNRHRRRPRPSASAVACSSRS